MNETIITLLRPNGESTEVKVKFANKPPWFIETSINELQTTRFEGDDLFECLCALRSKLDVLDIKILCNGSRIDAYPSPMSRGTGARKVYLHTMGQQARREDLVNIFDEALPEQVGTVEEQNEYHNKWFDSLEQ